MMRSASRAHALPRHSATRCLTGRLLRCISPDLTSAAARPKLFTRAASTFGPRAQCLGRQGSPGCADFMLVLSFDHYLDFSLALGASEHPPRDAAARSFRGPSRPRRTAGSRLKRARHPAPPTICAARTPQRPPRDDTLRPYSTRAERRHCDRRSWNRTINVTGAASRRAMR